MRSTRPRPASAKNSSGIATPTANESGQHHRADVDAAGRAGHDDRRQHGSRARHEHGAEGQPDAVPAPGVLHLGATGEPLERLLEHPLESRHEQADADQHEHRDPRPAQHVLRQAERAQQERAQQRDQREAGDEPGDDEVRPPARRRGRPVGRLGGETGRLCAARQEDDRQHRQDARRDPRDEPAEQTDDDELHESPLVSRVVRSTGRFGLDAGDGCRAPGSGIRSRPIRSGEASEQSV